MTTSCRVGHECSTSTSWRTTRKGSHISNCNTQHKQGSILHLDSDTNTQQPVKGGGDRIVASSRASSYPGALSFIARTSGERGCGQIGHTATGCIL